MTKPDRGTLTEGPDPISVDPTTPPAASDAPPKSRRKMAVLSVLALAVIGGATYQGHHFWTVGRFMVETDDAYVQADIALISSQVSGYVVDLPATENAHVKAGDVLLRLDDGDYRIALDTAKSRVETAGRTLARIDAQTAAARAAVTSAAAERAATEAQLRAAASTLERVSGLAERKVSTQAQLDTATENFDTATANLAKARAAELSAKAEVDVLIAQRAESEGDRHELELAVEQAQRNLDLTVLHAPADGTLANLSLEIGDLVSAGTRLAALVPNNALYIEANFKETQMSGVVPGAKVELSLDALSGQTFEGTVASVAPATGSVFSLLPADNATGNFTKVVQRVPVRISLPADALENGQLRAGLSAVVAVDTRTAPETDTALASVE
ncbi:HlyD family secretion protein [Celeribacter baekdonensis]|uniref:HlyD family secretion protein n=1 Tax=Celeribacter baekdonensis TaxID=875171 RepID=UPI0030DC4492